MGPALATPSVRRVAAHDVVLPPGMATPDTRGRILETALGLFAERGFAGTSIRDIAAGAGIRSATLYGHFPTKEHILAELSEAGHEAHRSRLAAAVAASAPDPVDELSAVVRAHVLFHAEYAMLAIVANVELHALSPELVAGSIATRAESERLFAGVAERGIAHGRFRTPDAWMAVAAIAGMGVRVANWFGPDDARSADDVADAYVEFALRILGAASPSDGKEHP